MIIQIDRAKKKVLIKREPKKSAALKTYVVIDYPQNGDTLAPEHYSLRIGASAGHPVEVSIDGGPWQSAREHSGYYWYDWHNIPAGKHTCVARIQLPDGKVKKSKAVSCRV